MLCWVRMYAVQMDDADLFLHALPRGSSMPTMLPSRCCMAYKNYNGPWHHTLHYHMYMRRWHPTSLVPGLMPPRTYEEVYL
jgi:hypothetical protein